MELSGHPIRCKTTTLTGLVLFIFALSFTYFLIQSGDALMYLTLVRDYLANGGWPRTDPYLYSLQGAELHTAHEYLSYFVFYFSWWVAGWSGLIGLKMLILSFIFVIVLRSKPRPHTASVSWMVLWCFAVVAASFRFIERSSLFSDLFCVLLLAWLIEAECVSLGLIIRLTALFFLWVQLHPGFPQALVLLGVWAGWHSLVTPNFAGRKLLWLLAPVLALVANPSGIEGVLYPFQFTLNQARVLKSYNFEWFPSYHEAFRWTPEMLAFWALLLAVGWLLTRERAWLTLRGIMTVVCTAFALQAVRFVPWVAFALLLIVKPYCRTGPWLRQRMILHVAVVVFMLAVAVKNLTLGYTGSSGLRLPRAGLDPNIFPIKTVEFFKSRPIAGRLYNAHDFGSYLLWSGVKPIFHHGFVTDMDFYVNDVVGIFKSQARFLEVAKKYNWTMLLVDKHGNYPYFYKILSPLPDWKIVSEDDASYLIYYLPSSHVLSEPRTPTH